SPSLPFEFRRTCSSFQRVYQLMERRPVRRASTDSIASGGSYMGLIYGYAGHGGCKGFTYSRQYSDHTSLGALVSRYNLSRSASVCGRFRLPVGLEFSYATAHARRQCERFVTTSPHGICFI